MPHVTAILPTYGHPELTLSAIARLREQSAPPAEIIVVDDGAASPFALPSDMGPLRQTENPGASFGMGRQPATPDIVPLRRAENPGASFGMGRRPVPSGIRVIRHDANRGFAAAVNTGVRAAQTELVAILNNDVTLAPDWLERLASVISSQAVDFACGKLYRPDGHIDGTFDLLCRGGLAWRAGSGRPDGPLWSTPQRILFTSYTAVLAKREAVVLDETYHSYYEDVEWSLRAAIENKTGYFDPSATGVHTGSATAGAWSAYSTRQLLRNHRRLAHQYLLPEYQREYRIARTLLRAHCLNHGQWPDVPAETVPAKIVDRTRLAELLTTSENQLRLLQADSTPDRLWRWYFRLTI